MNDPNRDIMPEMEAFVCLCFENFLPRWLKQHKIIAKMKKNDPMVNVLRITSDKESATKKNAARKKGSSVWCASIAECPELKTKWTPISVGQNKFGD